VKEVVRPESITVTMLSSPISLCDGDVRHSGDQ